MSPPLITFSDTNKKVIPFQFTTHATKDKSVEDLNKLIFKDGIVPEVGDTVIMECYEVELGEGFVNYNCMFKTIKACTDTPCA